PRAAGRHGSRAVAARARVRRARSTGGLHQNRPAGRSAPRPRSVRAADRTARTAVGRGTRRRAMTAPFRFRVGGFACLAISDGTYRCPAAMVFTNIPADRYESTIVGRGQSIAQMEMPLTSLVIETADHRVLVDTGGGALRPEFGQLTPALAAEGLSP